MALGQVQKRQWFPVGSDPFPGVHLEADGAVTLGERRYQPHGRLNGLGVGFLIVDREPGERTPLVVVGAGFRALLLFAEGQWYYADGSRNQSGDKKFANQPAVELEYVAPADLQPQSAAPVVWTPAERAATRHRASRGVPRTHGVLTCLATVGVLSALIVGVSGLFLPGSPLQGLGQDGWVAHFRFDATTWLATHAYHTPVTHAFLHTHANLLGYAVLGIVVFGALVARNVGFIRTVLLFCWCAAAGVGVWQLAQTQLGQDIYFRYLGKAWEWLTAKFGPEAGLWGAVVIDAVWQHMVSMNGIVFGAGGAIAGLMTFALVRRRYDTSATYEMKWWLVLLCPILILFAWRRSFSIRAGLRTLIVLPLIVAYIALGLSLNRTVLHNSPWAIPYILYFGGSLGGLFFIFPDRFLHEALDFARDKAGEMIQDRTLQGGKREAA